MMRVSPMFFARTILRGPERPPFGGRYGIGPHHIEWDALMTGPRRVAVQASRGSGKTWAWVFALVLWRAYYNIDGGILILTSSDDNAKRLLAEIKTEVEENSALRHLFPTRAQGKIYRSRDVIFSNGFRIFARGVGARIRGLHVPCIGDDILSDEAFYSEIYRRKIEDYWMSTVSNIPVGNMPLYLVGTPFNHADLLYHTLRENPAYVHRTYKAIGDDGQSIWPEYISRESLDEKRKEMGEIAFACQMQCDPVSQEGSLFPTALFMGSPQEQRSVCMRMSMERIRDLDLTVVAGVDIAFSATANADAFVIFVMGVGPQGERWVIDIVRRKGLPFQEQISLVNEIGRTYECESIYVEDNAAQRVLGDELMRETDLPIKKFTTTAQKHHMQSGLPALRLLAEGKKWRIPRGDRYSIEQSNIWLGELAGFTFVNGKCQTLAAHDDTVFSCYLADKAARWAGKFAPTTPEVADESGDQRAFGGVQGVTDALGRFHALRQQTP